MPDSSVISFAEQFFEKAAGFVEKYPTSEKTIAFGRQRVSITVPGAVRDATEPDILGGFWPADGRQDVDASITLFDNRFGIALPEGKWPADLHFPLGIVKEEASAPYRVAIDRHTKTVSVFDTRTNRCAVWIDSTAKLPYWAAATAFRLQLSWIANNINAELTHTAAVEREGNALLISGDSGVGKSTITMLIAQRGFGLISDDYSLVDGNKVYAVYTRGKLHDKSLMLPQLNHLNVLNKHTEGEKRIIDLLKSPGIRITRVATIKGLALPIQADMNAIQRISGGKALKLIAPASLGGILGGTPQSLMRLRKLTHAYPAFRWALSNEVTEDLRMLEQMWEQIV